jgi:hypothetical protein
MSKIKFATMFVVVFLLLTATSVPIINSSSKELKNRCSVIKKPIVNKHDTYDLVIITPEVFLSELQELRDHKNSHGVKTIIKTTEMIYDEYQGYDRAEQIKYFIKDALETWNSTFVLLVGGAEQIPIRYTHIYYDGYNLYPTPNEWVFPSDLYYADIYDETMSFSSWDTNENGVYAEYNWYGNTDEMDLYIDVYLGRLACSNNEELVTCVNKIITYETIEAYTKNWFTNLVVIGGDSLPGDTESIDEGEYVNEKIIEIMGGFTPIKIWASNGKLYDASNINDEIDNGAGFVFFNGHGNVDIWATHPHENNNIWIPTGYYTNSHIQSLSNKEKLPIVISDACYHCQYDRRSDCFGWKFITNADGGAIAFIGGSDIDLSYGGTEIITKGVEKLCLEISKNYKEGVTNLGELIGESINTYMSPNMDEIDIITVMENHLFGDPSLIIGLKSTAPLKPNPPIGVSSGKIGENYVYTTFTSDPDGDLIYYLFDWGDGSNSNWLGPYNSGVKVNASHKWTETGVYEIKVIAKDSHGVMSEWSDCSLVNMPKSFVNLMIMWFEKICDGFINLIYHTR